MTRKKEKMIRGGGEKYEREGKSEFFGRIM